MAVRTSSSVAMPEDMSKGSRVDAAFCSSGLLVISPEGSLMRATPSETSRSTACSENGVEKNSMPVRSACCASSRCWSPSSSSALIMANWLLAPVFTRWYCAVLALGVTTSSARNVWNLTASAPAARAASISCSAIARLPL